MEEGMKSILVATDLSKRSETAIARAFQLAERHSATLTVLHVVDSELPGNVLTAMRSEAEAQLRQVCQSVSAYPYTAKIVVDDPLLRIHAEADAVSAELIVLGAHRRRPFADFIVPGAHRARPFSDFLGGTTLVKLVRSSLHPVLVAKDPCAGAYRAPVCGLDFSPSSVAAATMAAALCPEARIALFHAVPEPFTWVPASQSADAEPRAVDPSAQQRLAAWLPGAGLPEQCDAPKLIAGGPADALKHMLEATNVDLVALGAHGRASYSPIQLGGFIEDLLFSQPRDLLIVRR